MICEWLGGLGVGKTGGIIIFKKEVISIDKNYYFDFIRDIKYKNL